ncbi:hypothetical protein [Sphingomonas lacusdianchii]|uniref:hypothetical protein n=1 Tax=Sphingomonas lacusdianchii TaxID=2917992 RepID=UPI001F584AB1|nr:hypothetical protein [Sphingomonas sp. JXJ CY 53]
MIDQQFYYATKDSPMGPMYVMEDDGVATPDHVYRDADGKPTRGGMIGQGITTVILLAGFAYCWFAI